MTEVAFHIVRPVIDNPIFRALMGIALLTGMDAVMKGQMQAQPLVQAVFMRFACGAAIILTIVAIVRPARPSPASLRANLVRVPVALMATLSFFLSVSILPLAEALAFAFLAPVFVAVFGVMLLREFIDRRIAIALAFGLAGMLVMVWPRLEGQTSHDLIGIGAALFSAVVYAFNLVLLRKLALHENPVTIVAFQNCGPALLLAIPAWLVWTPLGLRDLAMYGLAGSLAIAGLLVLTSAYAMAKAARLAAVDYTGLVWAALFGFVFFAEVPNLTTLAGAALIIAGAIAVSKR
jgi:S-adenosylmethionine uptake transporter